MNIKDKLRLLRQSTPNDLLYKFDLGNVFSVDIMSVTNYAEAKL